MTDDFAEHGSDYITMAGDIVSAYISNNHVAPQDLPALIAKVHEAVSGLGAGGSAAAATPEPVERPSAAQIRKSITPEALISFVDGKSYKTLKRHLTSHGLHPASYRARYGLPDDYPMVAPSYSERRSSLAKSIGLGVPGARNERVSEDEAGEKTAPKRRGRKAA